VVYKREKSKYWWFKFAWNGDTIRESTKQTNKRVAEQMEAARRTALAKGEVGIRDRKAVPTLAAFIEADFLPFVRTTFAAKVKTKAYYENGAKNLLAFKKLAIEPLDAITSEKIAGFVAKRQADGLQVASVNRELQALRRMFALAVEWGKVEKALPKVRMISGEAHRERVLTSAEEAVFLANASPLVHDVATILVDCALRPEECFRLQWVSIREGQIEIQYGKTDNARRHIPVSPRVAAILDMRKTGNATPWVFPAPTMSGHIEPSSLKKQHAKACKGKAKDDKQTGEKRYDVQPFPLYTLRHTCLTRWAPHMDPWTLAHLAGHRDMAITKRYVHPQADMIRAAMDRARVPAPVVSEAAILAPLPTSSKPS
jgi:integrase